MRRKAMSAQQSPLTYEGFLEMLRRSAEEFDRKLDRMAEEAAKRQAEAAQRQVESDRQFLETKQIMRENAKQMEKMRSEMGKWDSRIGRLVEHMVGGQHIVKQFQALGYAIRGHARNVSFGEQGTSDSGEIDLLLYDGNVNILVEVKTNLQNEDVLEHIEQMEQYRRDVDSVGEGTNKKFIGAVAGAVVAENVVKFAQRKGLYVIAQTGENFDILPVPEGFIAKKW